MTYRRWRTIGTVVAGALILVFLGWSIVDGWERVADYPWELRPGIFAVGLVALFIFYLVSGGAYVGILERLHTGRLGRRLSLSIWARSLLGRYVPGNVLMVLGRVVMAREAGVPVRVTLAATLYEQVLVLAVGAIGGALFLLRYGLDDPPSGVLVVLVLVAAAVVLLHPRIFGPASAAVLRRVGREPLAALLRGSEVTAFGIWYALATVPLAIGLWLVVLGSAGDEAGGPVFLGLAFLLAFAVGMIAFVFPSGIGVREGVLTLALSETLPISVAATIAVGLRLVITLVELAFVGAATLAGRRS
jgi:glycosyltransferase 2 family protein